METRIERMDHLGNGIGYIDGKIVFVKNSLPGEIVDVNITNSKSKFLTGKVSKILKPSSKRVEPFCPYFGICGGCDLQHLNYKNSLLYKKERVINILNKFSLNPVIVENNNPLNYRNKISLKVIDKRLGFYEKSTHKLTEIKKCKIAKESINKVIPLIDSFNIVNGDVIIRSNYNDEILIIINTSDDIKIESDYSNYKIIGIIINNKTVYGENHFMEKINDLFFLVSYDSFFQINNNINEKLFEIIKENVQGNTVLDLYSGVGTLSIMASENAKKVYGIEVIPNAVLNAALNVKINKKDNISFMLGKVEDKLLYIQDKIDTIIVDPPRKGLDKKTVECIIKFAPLKIIYISCDTQSLLKNLNDLTNNYIVRKSYILDMFSYSYHAETVIILERK